MRQRKKRFCTALLCAVLIISNVLSTGMPVYAKSPDIGSDVSDTAYSDQAAAPATEDGASDAPAASDDTNQEDEPGTDNRSGSDTGNDGAGAEEGTKEDGAGAEEGTKEDGAGAEEGTKEDGAGAEEGTKEDGAGAEEGTKEDDPAADPAPPEDSSVSGNDAEGEEGAVSENDMGEEDEKQAAIFAVRDVDYQTEDPEGYGLTDITMTPGSYRAEFSAISTNTSSSISSYNFKILYTTDAALADNFFPGQSKISATDLSASSCQIGEFTDWSSEYRFDEDSSAYVVDLSGIFAGEGVLTPETTYHYRLAHREYNYTTHEDDYYFLTVPDQFTTGAPVTESEISISNLSVEEIGYNNAKLVLTVNNPNREFFSNIKVSYTDLEGVPIGYVEAQEYQNADYTIVPNKYYAVIDVEQARKAKASLTTYIGAAEEFSVASEELTIPLKELDDAALTLTAKPGTGSMRAIVTLSPYYRIDSGNIRFYLSYRKKSESGWNQVVGAAYGSKDSTSVSVSLTVSNLSANTEYEYYIEPSGRLAEKKFDDLGSEDHPLTFTTKGIVTYEDTDFPDEVFRSFIKKRINIGASEAITSDKLEKLTSLDCDRSSASGDIRSLQGIEHLENLTSISFIGHAITDVGGLAALTGLTSIDLRSNDLTELPDLCGMNLLTSADFGDNRLKADTVTEAKLPASLLARRPDWVADTNESQRGETEVTLAPEYYAAGDARPFLLKVTGLKKDYQRKYTLSLTIDSKTVSGTGDNYYDIYYIKDVLKDSAGADTGISFSEGTPCEALITLTDSYGNEWLNRTESVTFAPADADTTVVTTRYILPNASRADINIDNLPASFTKDSIAGIELRDPSGAAVGSASASDIIIDSSSYNPYVEVFGYFYISDLTDRTAVRLYAPVYFAKYLSPGDYTAVITTTDGTVLTFEKAVCVSDAAVVDRLYEAANDRDGYFEKYGDYVYVRLSGANIDPARVQPVFYEGDTPITECVNGQIAGYNSDAAVYKLKKLEKDKYWKISGSRTFTYELQIADGYTVIDNIGKNKQISLYFDTAGHDFVTFEHYNYKKKVYEVKADATVPDGTMVSVSVYDNNSSRVLMGKDQGEIRNSLLALDFKNEQGESYAPPRNKAACFQYTYTDSDGNEQEFWHTNNGVEWYNYRDSSPSPKTAYTNTVLYHKALLKKLAISVFIPEDKVQAGQPIDAQIYTSGGAAVGAKTALAGKAAKGYINYTGTWQDAAGLGEGIYQIRYSRNGKQLYSHNLYVYDDEKFYMGNQWMYEWSDSSGEGICVVFSSEQLTGNYIHDHNRKVDAKTALTHWNTGGYKLELFDRLGNPVSGWKVDHASWSSGSFYVYLKNVPEYYTGFYTRITRSGELGIRLRNGAVYYADTYNATEKYGEWETFSSSSVWFNDSSNTNAYYGFSAYAYPVTVTITKPYDTDVIHSFTASAATEGNNYYFTASDLKDIDPKEAYRITAVSVDGSSRTEIGYLAVRGTSTKVSVTGVTLNKTALNMQLGQTEKLTATVKPDNATNKNVTWSTGNASVATVDAQGNVTATGTGETKITVTTADVGKTAACTVKVFNYTLNKTELSFDLSSGSSAQAETLTVSDGISDISSSVTWSSNDESVATVTRGGVVTPEGAGTAKILAGIKNGPTLICSVTVSRDTLNAVTMNQKEGTLYLDSKGDPVPQMPDTQRLKLYLTPGDTTVSGIAWTSDNTDVASVLADAKDPSAAVVTAYAKGTARITAAVTTKTGTKSAVCEITVKTVTTEADVPAKPDGLTALTNEQLTLEDVELPAGWEWQYPDASLKPFAGMQEKAFAAKYTNPADPDAAPYETELSVALCTVTGIAIGADSSTIHQGAEATLSVIWNRNGSGLDLSAYTEKVTWSSTKESVAKVQPANGGTVTLTAVGAGSATIQAQVTFKDSKTYKAKYKVSVVDGEIADIQVTAVDNFTADDNQPGAYCGKLVRDTDQNTGAIHAAVTGASKLTVKSNNKKVVTTGRVSAEGSGYSIPLTIKAAGMAKITLTANDKAKTRKELCLYVTDVKPNISEDTVTVNLWQTAGTVFTLYPNEGYQVISAALAGVNAAKFDLEGVEQTGTTQAYRITAKDGTVKGKYKLTLQGKVTADTTEYDYDSVEFTVKVVEQKPKYKLKQSAKVNLFYSDWENSLLNITSDELPEDAELTDCDFKLERKGSSWCIKADRTDPSGNWDKKGTLRLRFAGYKDVTADYTVKTENKKPACKLRSKSMTLYPAAGLDSAVLNPLVYRPDGEPYGDVLYTLDEDTASAGFILTYENPDHTGDFLIRYTKGSQNLRKKTYNASFKLTHDSWADEVTVPFTIKVNTSKPAAKLSKATLQLNTNAAAMAYDTAAAQVMWKDGAVFHPAGVSVSATDSKSRGIINTGVVFTFDRTNDQVIARLNNTAVATGKYNFKVNVKVDETLTVSTPLTVKVVDVAMDKAIKVSKKGSIDVLNREGSAVTVTPALKSLNGTITDVRLSGRAAHLFRAECADGKVIIRAKQDAALITKYNYKVRLNLTIENAEGVTVRHTTQEIKLKLKQGRPKVTVTPKSATLFSGSYESINRNISATLKGAAENPVITSIELMNNPGVFDCEYKDGMITIRNTPNAIKGKTYKLQFRVTFSGQADNEKATTVKYSVKVK